MYDQLEATTKNSAAKKPECIPENKLKSRNAFRKPVELLAY